MSRSLLLLLAFMALTSLPLIGVIAYTFTEDEITDNEDFFTLSISSVPQLDTATWNLTVDGLVDEPLNLTYADILALNPLNETATLKCVEGPSDTAEWTGVRVSVILDLVGVQPGAREVVFHAADGYSSSLTLDDASKDDVLLAYGMNGETLPEDHGYPLRLVVPEKAGYKWVKWVVRMEVVDYDYKGYWESRGWDDDADLTKVGEWSIHAALLSVAFILGGVAMVSGLKTSKRDRLFQDLPKWFDEMFHKKISKAYLSLLFVVFFYWVYTTLQMRGDVFYSGHGILGAVVVALHFAGAVTGSEKFIERPGGRVMHRFLNRFAYLFFAMTMGVGMLYAYGVTVF